MITYVFSVGFFSGTHVALGTTPTGVEIPCISLVGDISHSLSRLVLTQLHNFTCSTTHIISTHYTSFINQLDEC